MNSNLNTLYSWSEYNVFKIWIQRIQFEYRVFNSSTVYPILVQCIPIWVQGIYDLSTMNSNLSTLYSWSEYKCIQNLNWTYSIWVQCKKFEYSVSNFSTKYSNLSPMYLRFEYNEFQFEYIVFMKWVECIQNLNSLCSIQLQCIQYWVQCIPIWVHCVHNLSTMYSKLSTRYSVCSEIRSECPNKKEGGQLSLAEGNNTMLILNFNCVKTHLICSYFFVFESLVQNFVKNNIRLFQKELGIKKLLGQKKFRHEILWAKKFFWVKKLFRLKLCWVVVRFVWWGRLQNMRPLGSFFLVELEFLWWWVVGGGGGVKW